MPRFVILWNSGVHQIIEGNDIVDACIKTSLGYYVIKDIYAYTQEKEISAVANCGCVYHAKEGIACEHDIRNFWKNGVGPTKKYPRLTEEEKNKIIYSVRQLELS